MHGYVELKDGHLDRLSPHIPLIRFRKIQGNERAPGSQIALRKLVPNTGSELPRLSAS